MDFDLLADYLAVLEHGSILAAAEATGASQPTLSRRIRELEESLGVLLLNRTSRGVTPTVYGTLFKQHAEQVLRDHLLALDELRALQSGTHGHARIGMAPAFSGYLPGVIHKLRDTPPGVTFDVIEGTYDTLVQKTLAGEIDGGFTMLPPGESVESLAVRMLSEQPLVIVADAAHPMTDHKDLLLKDLRGQSWVMMNRPRSILGSFAQIASAQGLPDPEISIETSSLEFLKSVLKNSLLISALPVGAVHAELRDGSFKTLDVGKMPRVETGFVHRHGVLPPLVMELVHEVDSAVK